MPAYRYISVVVFVLLVTLAGCATKQPRNTPSPGVNNNTVLSESLTDISAITTRQPQYALTGISDRGFKYSPFTPADGYSYTILSITFMPKYNVSIRTNNLATVEINGKSLPGIIESSDKDKWMNLNMTGGQTLTAGEKSVIRYLFTLPDEQQDIAIVKAFGKSYKLTDLIRNARQEGTHRTDSAHQ